MRILSSTKFPKKSKPGNSSKPRWYCSTGRSPGRYIVSRRKWLMVICLALYIKMTINKFFIFFINIYKKNISLLLPASCRFYPSCSEYSKQAFEKYNFIKAFLLSVYRVLRCNPWNKGGYDPLK